MRERIRFMGIYFLFWTLFFVIARVIFLSYHIQDTKDLTLETIFGIFAHGVKMDLSMAAYLCIVPFLMVTFSNFIKKSILQNTIFTYTFTFISVLTLLIVVDLEVYNTWSFRIDATPLGYLKSPSEAWASIRSSPVFALILSTIIIIALASNIVYRILANKIYDWKSIGVFPFVLEGLIISFALLIPIRGGIGIAPMNHSSVYFSKVNFANIAALNAPWNFFSSIFHKRSNKVNPFTYLPKEHLESELTELYRSGGAVSSVLNTSKPNVLFIVWESLTAKALNYHHNGIEVLPNLNKLTRNSLYFSNLYASGDRTDKALPAIISGYPAQPTESIIKDPVKTQKLSFISHIFNEKGYNTSFYYGGDTEFANMKSYLFKANFEKIVDYGDFPSALNTSKWGVHDEYLFDSFLKSNNYTSEKSFFSVLLTLSSHEPFETSKPVSISGDQMVDKYMNSLHYTDGELASFLEKAQKLPWWKNTLVIIVGDHGHRLPPSTQRKEDFKIPMIWTGGAVNKVQNVSKIGSQIDIASTLMSQLKYNTKAFEWSKNIFDATTGSWAYFSFNNGFGFVNPTKYLLFDNVGKRLIEGNADPKTKELRQAKSIQQKTFQDFLDR